MPGGRSAVTMGMPGVTNTSQPRAGFGFTCAFAVFAGLGSFGDMFDLLCDRFFIGQSVVEGQGAPGARNDWSVRQSSQLAIEKGVCPLVGECCRLSVVVRPTMPREGMTLARIAVDCRVWFLSKCRFNPGLRSLGNELVFLGQMHQQRRSKPVDLTQIFLSVTAVISDRSVDAVAHGCQKDHQPAEAVAEDGYLAGAFRQL